MGYSASIGAYVESLNLKTERAKKDYAKHLTASIDFIEQQGLDVNSEDTFSALNAFLRKDFAETTAQKRVNLTRRFFDWISTLEGGNIMDNINIPLEASNNLVPNMAEPLPETEGEINEQPPALDEEKRKKGRPIKGKEERDKKITVNIPASIWTAIQDISRIDGVTFPDTVNAFLEQAVNARYEDIEALRLIRAKRH